MVLNKTHFSEFARIPHVPQRAVGNAPASWVNKFSLENVPDIANLPTVQLDRRAVKTICQSRDYCVLFGYVCVMAWGLQRWHVSRAWKQREAIKAKLKKLRSGRLTRANAYDLFSNESRVCGLGPAFFTKLLYFFSPEPGFYILDQWTGKSVNLLTGKQIIQISAGGSLTCENTGENYKAFCGVIDSLSWHLGITGEEVEERLFSRGGSHPAPWRAYLKQNYRSG